MKILHIISSGGMYGAEAVILNLSRTLNAAGHRSALGVFANSAHTNVQLHERAVKYGIESHLIPCSGQVDTTVPARIQELVKQTGTNVVHAHGYKADVYVYLALRNSSLPIISTCHTWYDNNLLLTFYGMVDRFVLRKYGAVVAVSGEVKEKLLKAGVQHDQIHLICNGINLRPFEMPVPSLKDNTSGEARLSIGLVGRLSTEKGVDLFIQAASQVLADIPGAHFVVVGEGPDHKRLQSMIDRMKLGDKIELLGRRDDMPSVYASFDVMVSASRQEGLPMAILEGMASERAIIATAVGEVPSVIRDGSTGVLVPPEDVNALAIAISALLEDPMRRKSLGAAARKLVEMEFSVERMTTNYLRVYEEATLSSRSNIRKI